MVVSLLLIFLMGYTTGYVYPPPYPPGQYGYFVPVNQTGPNYGWTNNNNNNRNTNFANQQPNVGSKTDIVMGSRQPGDTTLFNTIVTKSPGLFRSVAVKEIAFPAPDSGRRISRITSIVVSDNTKNNSGGFPQVVAGGVGKSFVNLRFKSQNGRPIDKSLMIFGFN